mmetsp:Transcript_11976/g.20220  ORF Transcript_11976/g.20220 Transcript_11976/m.20220 type:complete len:247 (-) Transcript_11976:934-1674(-)
MDKFEAQYNFRFEDKNAAYLTTYARQPAEDSMRRQDDKRKQQRQEEKQRKEEEKLRKKEEINKLKALKRQEILDKIKQAQFLAGTFGKDKEGNSGRMRMLDDKRLLEKAERELQTEFIPDLYDKTMDALFNDDYYQASDVQAEDLENDCDIDMRLLNDKVEGIGQLKEGEEEELASDVNLEQVEGADDEELLEKIKSKKQEKYERMVAKSLKKQVDQREQEQGFETWFTCDQCFSAIQAGHHQFEC